MPRKLDGLDSAMQEPILRFIRQLEGRYNLPVDVVSEQLSSLEAEQRLKQTRQAGRKRKVRKEEIDQIAATIILKAGFRNTIMDNKNYNLAALLDQLEQQTKPMDVQQTPH